MTQPIHHPSSSASGGASGHHHHSGNTNLQMTPQAANLREAHTRIDQQYHFHISERPTSTVKNMDRKPKSIVCNSGGIVVAEMVYRCLMCRIIFETPLDCRTHFRCFHAEQYEKFL